MIDPGETLGQFLSHMIFWGHYYYGYPFYFISALYLLPLSIAFRLLAIPESIQLYVLVLRQLSPLFMLAAITVLVYLLTGFRTTWRSVLLFVFLSSIPAVFRNNLWWHPDSLTTLFVVLTGSTA